MGRSYCRPETQEIPPKLPPGGFWSVRLALPAMLTATLPISVALLATTTIRLLFLLPGLMLFAALLSALALTALPTLLAISVLLALIVLVHVFLLLCRPRNKRLNRAAVPESSLDAISLRATKKGATPSGTLGQA